MIWNNFIILVVTAYAVYYGLNIIFDMLRALKPGMDKETEALEFEENFEPTTVDPGGYAQDVTHSEASTDSGNVNGETDGIKKEQQPNLESDDMDIQVEPIHIETIVQSPISGGVSYADLFKLCREKAIVESTKFNFGY